MVLKDRHTGITMIRYALKCSHDHGFESWFQSAEAFEKLKAAGMVYCPRCNDTDVRKAIMAPRIRPSREAAAPEQGAEPAPDAPRMHALTAPSSPAEAAMLELKKKIQENSEYVGPDFADEARKIHLGDAPERSIYGEATSEDAQKLAEEGVPVAPLPFVPSRKTN